MIFSNITGANPGVLLRASFLASLCALLSCSTSASGPTDALESAAKPRPGYKSYSSAVRFFSGKSVIPANGGYAFYLSADGILSSVPQNRKFTVNSSSLSDLPPLTVTLVTGRAFRGAPHKNAIVRNRVIGKEAICSQEVTVFGKDDPICLPLYHDANGKLFEPAFNSELLVFDGPEAFKAAAIDYSEDGNAPALARLAEVFPEDKKISELLEKKIAEVKAKKQQQASTNSEARSSGSGGVGLLGALVMGALRTLSTTSSSSGSSLSTASADYRPNYEYVVHCRDRRLFGDDIRTEVSLGTCRGYEAECEQNFYNKLELEGSFTSFCRRKIGSEFVTDRIAKKGS